MGTSAPTSPTHGKGLRPMYFISRGSGKLTPLIPADELPDSVVLVNIKKTMTLKDTAGMTSIGEIPHSGAVYELDVKNSSVTTGSVSDSPSGVWRGKNLTIISPDKAHANSAPTSAVDGPWRANNRPESSDLGSNPLQVVPFASTFSNDRTSQDKKLYCSYWLRHGECDYLQQGCKYLHVMPTDLETLNKCGLRDIPRWYRNQQALLQHQANINRVGEGRPTAVTSLIESGLAGSAVSPMSPPVTPSKLTARSEPQRMAALPGPQNYLTGGFANGQAQFDANMAAFGPFNFGTAFPYSTAAMNSVDVSSNPASAIDTPIRYDQFAPFGQLTVPIQPQEARPPTTAGSHRIPIRDPNDLGFLNRISDLKVSDTGKSESSSFSRSNGGRSASSNFNTAIARPQRGEDEKDLIKG